LKDEKEDLPIVIVRPSIVTSAAKEPMPGWTDNINGPIGVIVGAGKGFLKVIRANPDLVGDIIPVDFTINLMIALAWYTATSTKYTYIYTYILDGSFNIIKCIYRSKEIKVFTCSTGLQNPIKWGQLHKHLEELRMKFPFSGMFWYPNPIYVSSKYAYHTAAFFFHYIPAYMIDFIAFFIGKKTRAVNT